MSALKVRGESPFEEAGEGYFLRFTNADIAALGQKFGVDFHLQAHTRLVSMDLDFLNSMAAAGVKRDGKAVPEAEVLALLDDIPISVSTERLLNALYVSLYGKTFQESVEELSALVAKANAEGNDPNPLSPDGALPTIFGDALSGPASTPPSSGHYALAKPESSPAKAKKRDSGKRGR